MDKFMAKLIQQAQDNPAAAFGIGAALIASTSKLIDSISSARGRAAYAKQVNYRVKNKK